MSKEPINYREVVIMSAVDATIEIYTVPDSVKTADDFDIYLSETLKVDSSTDWIAGPKIVLTDYRK